MQVYVMYVYVCTMCVCMVYLFADHEICHIPASVSGGTEGVAVTVTVVVYVLSEAVEEKAVTVCARPVDPTHRFI